MEVKVGCVYKHFKGTYYKVLMIAKHTETREDLVVYTHGDSIWARPVDMFLSKVDKDKYPDINQEYRFELVVDENDNWGWGNYSKREVLWRY